ncbi:MAG: hypothetical protein ACRDOI_00735 [Trebonia sp.]
MTPAELLAGARTLIARPDAATTGVWPHAAALLTRQALEDAVNARWARDEADLPMKRASMRSRLIALPFYLDGATARQMTFVNAALTGACHYHPYELAPTAVELTRWIDDVDALVTLLDGPAETGTSLNSGTAGGSS